MSSSLGARVVGCAILVASSGCWEGASSMRADPRRVAEVHLSRQEPIGCRAMGAVEGHGADSDGDASTFQAAYDEVRNAAALRGGNLVVIDAIGQPRLVGPSRWSPGYSIAGRLYRCDGPYASASTPPPSVEPGPSPVELPEDAVELPATVEPRGPDPATFATALCAP